MIQSSQLTIVQKGRGRRRGSPRAGGELWNRAARSADSSSTGFSAMKDECNSLCAGPHRFLFSCGLPVLWLLAAMCVYSAGCSSGGKEKSVNPTLYDLMERFAPVDSASSESQFRKHMLVIRKGVRKDALVAVSPVIIRAPLQGVSGQMVLQGFAAPVFNIGDGIQMNIFLRYAGISRPISSRYFDPGRKIEDREWIPIEIPLTLSEGEQLEIQAVAGPRGDSTADWLALSSMQLASKKAIE